MKLDLNLCPILQKTKEGFMKKAFVGLAILLAFLLSISGVVTADKYMTQEEFKKMVEFEKRRLKEKKCNSPSAEWNSYCERKKRDQIMELEKDPEYYFYKKSSSPTNIITPPPNLPPNQGAIDLRTGKHYPPVAGGIIDPETGTFHQKVGGGYINSKTGEFIPAQ